MSHVAHRGPDDAVYYDDCEECTFKAKQPHVYLDTTNLRTLWLRMLAAQWAVGGKAVTVEGEKAPYYRTETERDAGQVLFAISLFLQRHEWTKRQYDYLNGLSVLR